MDIRKNLRQRHNRSPSMSDDVPFDMGENGGFPGPKTSSAQRKMGTRMQLQVTSVNEDELNKDIQVRPTASPSGEYKYQTSYHIGLYKNSRSPSPHIHEEMGALLDPSSTRLRTSSLENISPAEKDNPKRMTLWKKLSGVARVFRCMVEDWIYLALLGLIMAVCSLTMDMCINQFQTYHMSLYDAVETSHWSVRYLVWVLYVVLLTVASSLFVHYMAPQAIGSGIPEMKTILRGVILKEYLTFRTLVSKMVGLTLSLGSGLPIGKEGPFVHVASVVANLLSGFVHGSTGIYQNESRSSEMLAAGCAVGVACTFSAPVGGVLFSIEVTSVYFAVRNYWRGFFAATCSATFFRVLRMLQKRKDAWDSASVEAHYQTNFPSKDAFMLSEIPAFAFIGIVCGLLGALFICLHRNMVMFLRRNKMAKALFPKYWLVYPIVISLMISSITFPHGLGQYLGGEQKFSHTLAEFFAECSYTVNANHTRACQKGGTVNMAHWTGENGQINIFTSLILFQITFFFLCIIASTLPFPAGIFMPVCILGAAFGRMFGEFLASTYPEGLDKELPNVLVFPGIYAVAGAAAFCGAVTHTVSVAVIVFELTGQLIHLLPVMIAVLVANAVSSYLQPSIYDSMIKIKHLPYLPDIPHTSSNFHRVNAEQLMVSPVKFIARDSTYGELQDVLHAMPRLRAFPLVESKESMALLGSISKGQLHKVLESKVGLKARQAEAANRVKFALNDVDQRFRLAQTTIEASVEELQVPRNRFTIVPAKLELNGVPMIECAEGRNSLTVGGLTNQQREAIFAMGKKRTRSGSDVADHQHTFDLQHTIGGMLRSLTRRSFGRHKKDIQDDFDLYGDERKSWEVEMLTNIVDLKDIQIDPAPFQLVEHTSLFKVHSLFSLLGLNRAYVTKCGKLIGVVALKELRLAIEFVQAGRMPGEGESFFHNGEMIDDNEDTEEEEEDDFLYPRLEVVSRGSTADNLDGFGKTVCEREEMPEKPDGESKGNGTVASSSEDPLLQGRRHNSLSDPGMRLENLTDEATEGLTLMVPSLPPTTTERSRSPDGILINFSPAITPEIISECADGQTTDAGRQRKNRGRHVQIVMPTDDEDEEV